MIKVEAYNPQWAVWFAEFHATIWPAVKDYALSLEHVGSTSVPGLAAKPIIDLDIIVRDGEALRAVIQRLKGIGYEHRGNWGIEGREAFRAPDGPIEHHLYACLEGCASLRNHLTLRDHLRHSAPDRAAYSALKRALAFKFPDSIDDYVEGKTGFITTILAQYEMTPSEIDAITRANRAPS